MVEQKFKIGDRVKHKGNVCVVTDAHLVYFHDGQRWVYFLDGEKFFTVEEKELDEITISSMQEKPVRTKEKGKKRKHNK